MFEVRNVYWANGKLKKETSFCKNKKEGVEKKYNEKGILKSTVEYSNDLIDGYIKTYYESGMLESRELFKKGVRANELLIYNEEGVLVYSSNPDYIAHRPLCMYDDYCLKKHI